MGLALAHPQPVVHLRLVLRPRPVALLLLQPRLLLPAEPPPVAVEAAEARTDIALHTAVIELGPIAGGNGMGRFKVFHFRIEKESGRDSSQRWTAPSV